MRSKRFLYNTISSLFSQIITIICGMIFPYIMISGFGSELYGATTSIAEFLGYISLLEGGIGGVARSALYKPLAEHDSIDVNDIITAVKSFFKKLSIIFVGYTFIIACTYKYIASEYSFDWGFTFALVIVISLSTFAEYFFGITNTLLVQADQRGYIARTLQCFAIAVNTALAYILIYYHCNILVVKLFYCLIHVIRIIILNIYVKKRYQIKTTKRVSGSQKLLAQKWDCLGQHIAFFVHSKTDIFVLTIFANMCDVAVYSIYNYITTSLMVLSGSFISGAEAVFGNMLAKNEKDSLNNFFDLTEFMIHTIVIVLFSVAAIVIMPFIRLYTAGFSDAEYYRPMVAYLLLLAEGIYCVRQPYHQMTIAAGQFRATRNAAFIEAGLNVGLSCILVGKYGIAGVAAATVVAMTYRAFYYIVYLSKNIINRSIYKFLKRWLITLVNISSILVVFTILPFNFDNITNYVQWIACSVLVGIIISGITALFSFLFYRKEWNKFCERGKSILKRTL